MPKLGGEALRRKREKLEAELEALRTVERTSEEQKNAIAGRIVLEHARKDAAFAETLSRILDGSLRKRRERELFDLPRTSKSASSFRAKAGPAKPATTSTAEEVLPAAGGLDPN